jgi:hypothetical protein
MKKILLAGVTALALLGLSQQQASAWTKFCAGASFNLSFQSGGHKWCCTSDPYPFCDGNSCGYGYTAGYGYPAYAAQAPQTPMPQAQTGLTQTYGGYQTVGYYPSYGYSYGYYAPSYWYGR